ncbi:glycoside hydrolase family 10 protein [Salinibacter sp.]|uniref:glycoside hydrolase family 10 protein n=1 Tax=Salinibacter sp. TaxID=2065818 RepID=UPI0035D42ADE
MVFLLGFSAGCGDAPSSNEKNGDSDTTASVQCENPPASDELRGVWVTNVDSDVLDSQANIEQAMTVLADHNFNVVFPVVWNDAATMYPSTVMDTLIGRSIDPQYEGRDPLQELVKAAHENGLAVIPWFEFGFSSSYQAEGGPILDKYPSWAARNRNGELVTKNGFDWMNGYKPAVQDLLMDLVLEVVRNYKVDGIQGDDRLPANPVEGGYSDYTKTLYRSEHDGQNPPSNPRNEAWKEWRADKLSDFGRRLYDKVKAVDSSLVVSWAPSPYPFGYNEYLQDWPAWINRGFTDLVHPQVYRRDVSEYKSFLATQRADEAGWNADKVLGFYPGVLMKVGDYRMTPEELKEVILTNRRRGIDGEVFFFYEGLHENDGALADVLKSCYSESADLPFDPAHVP